MTTVLKEVTPDGICPTCGIPVVGHRCLFCGATKTVNQVSRNVMWMRNGHLVAAFHDEKAAWCEIAERFNISKEEWPEQFR